MQKTKQPDAIRTEDGLSYAVRIEAMFGSQLLHTVVSWSPLRSQVLAQPGKNLNRMLAAWKELVEAQHKKNAVTVIRSRD